MIRNSLNNNCQKIVTTAPTASVYIAITSKKKSQKIIKPNRKLISPSAIMDLMENALTVWDKKIRIRRSM